MRSLVIATLCFFIFACGSDLPDDVMPEDQFEAMLYEVHLADALLVTNNLSDRKLKSPNQSYYNYLYIKYKVNRRSFEKSVHYYSDNTQNYKAIYDRILIRFSNEKNELLRNDSIQESKKTARQKAITDSLARIATQDSLRTDSILRDSLKITIEKIKELILDGTSVTELKLDSLRLDSIKFASKLSLPDTVEPIQIDTTHLQKTNKPQINSHKRDSIQKLKKRN